jgi:hypothetical protein
MSRERLTSKSLTAADSSFGQSANDYWRTRAKEAIQGALSEVEKEIYEAAQKITNEEAAQLGVQPAKYASENGENKEAEDETEKEEGSRMAMVFEPRSAKEASSKELVFEPRSKTAGAPVVPGDIGKANWFQVQEQFPQYTKQQKLTMLSVAPTGRNMEAVSAITDTLDSIASKLEEAGDASSATQLDVISELLTASIEECNRIKASRQ